MPLNNRLYVDRIFVGCFFFLKYGLHLLQRILSAIFKRLLLGSKFYQYTNEPLKVLSGLSLYNTSGKPNAVHGDQRFAFREELLL